MSDILKTSDEAAVLVPRHVPGTKYSDPGFVNPCWDLDAVEFEDLKQRIKAAGFSPAFPIIRSAGPVFPGAIVDGFHRQHVCDVLASEGTPVSPVYYDQPFETEAEFRIAQIDGNLRRRQLPPVKQAVLAKERQGWIERLAANKRQGTRTDRPNIQESFPESSRGQTRDAIAKDLDMSGRTYEKYTYAWEHGDDFIRQELESQRRGADWGYKAAKEWRDAEAETGQTWATYTAYRAWVEEQRQALDHQAQWEAEYEELLNHDADVDTEARAKGHDGAYIRAELEKLDRYWNSHAVVDGIVVDGALHTFEGVLLRWSERIADMLKIWADR